MPARIFRFFFANHGTSMAGIEEVICHDWQKNEKYALALLNELKIPGRDIISVLEELNNVDKLEDYGLLKGDPYYYPVAGRQACSITLNSSKPSHTGAQNNNVGPANSH